MLQSTRCESGLQLEGTPKRTRVRVLVLGGTMLSGRLLELESWVSLRGCEVQAQSPVQQHPEVSPSGGDWILRALTSPVSEPILNE